MAFLLQHVTPLKLWVVGIVYLALELHIISLHVPFPFPFLIPCPASIAHSPYIILWILYCLSLARDSSENYFSSESYNGLLPVRLLSQMKQLVSAKYVLYQLENVSNKNSHG